MASKGGCSVAHYEAHVANLDNRSGHIDLFWPGVLIVEQKSAGRDLVARAYHQAGEYLDALPEIQRPGCILFIDFQSFELHDLAGRETAAFTLSDLHAHVEKFRDARMSHRIRIHKEYGGL